MPVTVGAIRKQRVDKRRTQLNLRVKTAFKGAVSVMRKRPTAKNLVLAYRLLDRAAKSNVVHPNKAARLKSRLSNLLEKKPKKK